MSLSQLLNTRYFLPLFLTQFFGAFNDNAFKLAMLTSVSYYLSHSQIQSERYQVLASALFILPFFVFSATAGQLADKLDKAHLIRWIKLFEIALMTMGGLALYAGSIVWMMVTLTGLGVHSTFFGPIKYAILPEHLAKSNLLGATALIEGSTFLAILLGTTFGTLSVLGTRAGSLGAILLTVGVALLGFLCSLKIPSTPSHAKELMINYNVWRATKQILATAKQNKQAMMTIYLISWFWLIGGVILTKLPDYTNYVLRADTTIFALFLALFSIGIAMGSMAVNAGLRGKIQLRIVPYAMLFLSLFACDLYWVSPVSSQVPLQSMAVFFKQTAHWRIACDLFLLAFSGGVFVVPLYAYLQVVSAPSVRARTIAANNIMNSLFMVFGSLYVMILLYFQASIAQVLLGIGVLNAFAAVYFRYFHVAFLENQEHT